MTLYRATFLHTPVNPFHHSDALKIEDDGGLLVQNGQIRESGSFADLKAAHPTETVEDLRGGLLLPGFIDTHVHYPQVRVIGGLGVPLLDWLDKYALPEEARFGDSAHAATVAREFVSGLISSGTTTALVFGSHFASAVDTLFQETEQVGLRTVAGQVVSDRMLRPELHTTPERAYSEGKALIEKWHGKGENRYAVTPRFSLSASEGILEACAALMKEFPGVHFTSHSNENLKEVQTVRQLFLKSRDYIDTYEQAGLLGRRSVLAHNVHMTDRELGAMATHNCTSAHCPCSNSALGSGFFPLKRHLAAGVRVSLGTDVGGGTGFSMLKEGLQAYFMQQLLGDSGVPLEPSHLLYLATRAGAEALEMDGQIGDFSAGKAFDASLFQPPEGSTMQAVLNNAHSTERALASLFAGGTQADVKRVWIGGKEVFTRRETAQAEPVSA
ncbi:guanine deaminase (plasmid) [Deinococcus psychrotolerans]|uniref:Guanine deaminase n=1 Tax=Deinococcus psychrotolerans TaxID=2489213 RepID=A0A3G8YHX7_9DEIO|nr:guanine deaminase [Deinococcus psychrotolerans]AZI44565.1 guanine deaminase [Deinococcus psychrotolerans]